MEDFYYAGGLPAVMRILDERGLLHGGAATVNGKTVTENCQDARNWNEEVIRTFDNPVAKRGGIVVVRGNLAPDGAVIKPSAASAHLMRHRGRAVVFENIENYKLRIDDPALDVDESCFLVLKNCGPKGYPGMPEVGNLGLPAKLLKRGVTDMVRLSDARMSGTAYGTVLLHVCPEAAVGGPLALVRDGDMIELDVEGGSLNLVVPDEELLRRRAQWKAPEACTSGGYQQLYVQHVMQADKGADLDFLVGCRGHAVPRESH
jgi:dihydroxyacid dehydratase/phosphogluconate dehydratase